MIEQPAHQYVYKTLDTKTKREISMNIMSERVSMPYLGSGV